MTGENKYGKVGNVAVRWRSRVLFGRSEVGIILALGILGLGGCGESSPPPRAPAASAVTQPVPPSSPPPPPAAPAPAPEAPPAESPISPAAAAKVPDTPPPVEEYSYQPGKRREPFRSILVKAETEKSPRVLPPLQRIPVEEIRLIGVVWGGFGYSAMMQTPDGKGYTVRVGTLIGTNGGKVTGITAQNVIIEEKYTDIFGEKKIRDVKIDLHPQKEGSE